MRKLNAKEIVLPSLALFLICVAVAGALAAVNAVTVAPIARNALHEANEAKRQLFPGARFDGIAAYQGDELAGYCIEAEAQGYGGALKVMVGLTPDGEVQHVKVLDASGETPGLGQKVKEDSFLKQFAGQSAIKSVDGIASATYSSRGVMNAVNAALDVYRKEVRK
jgi:electron transport complex protein RnfG